MQYKFKSLRKLLLWGSATALVGGFVIVGAAVAQDKRTYSIGEKDLAAALREFTFASGRDLIFSSDLVEGRTANAVNGTFSDEEVLSQLLSGTGLSFERTSQGALILRRLPEKIKSSLTLEAGDVQVAQAASPPPSRQQVTESVEPEEIVVTGTRVVRNGYEAPTPVSVLSADDLNLSAKTNIADAVSQLPSFSNSVLSRGNSVIHHIAGTAGMSNLNLRGMGPNRTLILLDGVRIVSSTVAGLENNGGAVDINSIPDDLVSRVDVVTGGASAAYGSDALTGVVNFVLDRNFTGVKGSVEGGITTYGDDPSYRTTLSVGLPFNDGEGHFLISGRHSYNAGVPYATPPDYHRPWRTGNSAIINNPAYTATNGQPRYVVAHNVGLVNATPGGLISAGPLKGVVFGPGGTPTEFNYGPVISGNLMQGGDWQVSRLDLYPDLDFRLVRSSAFTRVSHSIGDTVTAYAQFQYSQSHASNRNIMNWHFGNVSVSTDNAFLPAAVAARAAQAGVTNFLLGTLNGDIGPLFMDNTLTLNRYVGGFDGTLDAFDATWNWDASYQMGMTRISANGGNNEIRNNYNLAVDAVRNPATGAIVCRSTLANPGNGCVPYNVFGVGVNSAAAIDYVTGTAHMSQTIRQDVFATSTSGEPFSSWAGPVSLALGIEHRREKTYGAVTDIDAATGFFTGNFKVTTGQYNVTEGFVETVVPLAMNTWWASAFDFNAAVRATNYSTSGYVTTWKVGATYAPIDDLRFRATRSRDIRAPNLGDLFLGGRTGTSTVNDPATGRAISLTSVSTGNPALQPERADTIGFGAVFSPQWLQGFTTSIDYYDIDIKGAISLLTIQEFVNRCYEGNQEICKFVFRDAGGTINRVELKPANVLSQTTKGIDFEASYQVPLEDLVDSWNGELSLRGMATYVMELKTIDQQKITEGAGVNADNAGLGTSSFIAPKLRYNATLIYTNNPFTAALTFRGIGSGKYNDSLIACTSGCPTSTAERPTIDTNYIAPVSYLDLSLNYQLPGYNSEVFLVVENIANKDLPSIAGSLTTGFILGSGAFNLYDSLGRSFRAGVRFKM